MDAKCSAISTRRISEAERDRKLKDERREKKLERYDNGGEEENDDEALFYLFL